jgi:glutamate racemase
MPASDAQIHAEIAPCSLDDGARTDTIVLACTHYPLLIDRLTKLAPWKVSFIDPAPAIARRVVDLLGPATATWTGTACAIFTSGQLPQAVLARFGIRAGVPATTSAARHVV